MHAPGEYNMKIGQDILDSFIFQKSMRNNMRQFFSLDKKKKNGVVCIFVIIISKNFIIKKSARRQKQNSQNKTCRCCLEMALALSHKILVVLQY